MGVYVIEYELDHQHDSLLHDSEAAHLEFLRRLEDKGVLITAGALRDVMSEDALIVLRADSAEDALKVLDEDPIYAHNAVHDRRVREWRPLVGRGAVEYDTEFPIS